MAIKELTQEQIRTWTLEQKDRWWLENVYRGDMKQLTLRSALTGMILGGILSCTNLYVGIKTGWSLGVGITSVVLSFAMFKALSKIGLGEEMTVLENNAMQSVATSAGYMCSPLVSSIPAYMLVTGKSIPLYQTFFWTVSLSMLGVLFAFPLKKRFINDEQLPFPEGAAAGIVMDNLHSEGGSDGMFKAKLLGIGGAVAAAIEFFRNETVTKAAGLWKLPDHLDDFIYKFYTPKILGTPLKDLTIQVDSSITMVAAGGLMNIKTGFSLMVGAFINYFILAPILIHEGVIKGTGFKAITMWALWGGVAMMTTSSLYSFLSKPEMIFRALKAPFQKKGEKTEDILKDIELPMSVFMWGIPIMSAIVVYLGHEFFNLAYWEGILAIPLIAVFTLIAVNSTGLTSITPGGALGKLTQLTYSIIAPGNVPVNIVAAGINGEVSLNASNLLMDIKPGYMLGAKPRHQAIGHVLGIWAGALCCVPLFYLIFHGDLSLLTSEKLPMPGATIWRAVAEVLTQGLSFLHPTARWAALIGAALGIAFEMANTRMKGRFMLSGVGVGLAFVLHFTDALAMSMGAFLFWYFEKTLTNKESTSYKTMVENRETLCAGAIAGGSLIGIILIIVESL